MNKEQLVSMIKSGYALEISAEEIAEKVLAHFDDISNDSEEPWVGVDLDGTLAHYDTWKQWDDIGEPIQPMLDRVKKWVAKGVDVRIFTARGAWLFDTCKVSGVVFTREMVSSNIQDWLERQGLPRLKVTNRKDYRMVELWDDRAIQVIPNTGRTVADELASVRLAHEGKAAP